MAFAIVNNLHNRTSCDQVALGLVHGRHVKVLAVSGFDDLPKRSPGMVKIRSAMEECLDLGRPIVCEKPGEQTDDDSQGTYLLHRQWQEAGAGGSVASIPLKVGDNVSAIVSCRGTSNILKPENIDKLTDLLAPYGPALEVVHLATRGVLSHTVAAFYGGCRSAVAPRRWTRKVAACVLAGLLAWIAFGTMQYELTVPCNVSALESRHVAAPFEAMLLDAPLAPGDQVVKGQVLCRLDDRELTLERDRLSAELNVARIEESKAIADALPVPAALARTKQKHLSASLRIIERKIAESVLRAPFDGTIASGDLRRHVGTVLQHGQPLYELSSERGLTLQLSIPESEIAHVRRDLTGDFASVARPEVPQSFRIVRVLPAARQQDNTNCYVAEADVNDPPQWLRSGMEGNAKVRAGRRHVWWVLFHRAINYARMKFWF